MTKTIVFDFDKTLTYRDSLRELFLQEMKGLKCPLRIIYWGLILLSKMRLINVKKEKEIMIGLLFHYDEDLFLRKCKMQAGILMLTPLFSKVKENVVDGNRVIILSASSVFLLNEIFYGLNVEVIGMTFISEKGKIRKINQHPFSTEKYELMIGNGIKTIDEMFYDSHNDECLIPLCKKWHRIKDGVIIETKERK